MLIIKLISATLALGVLLCCQASRRCHDISPFGTRTTEKWVEESLHNLSTWRSTLMSRAHRRYRAQRGSDEDKKAAAHLLQGLPMYQLYQPWQSCPPPLTLQYYGPPRDKAEDYSEGGKWVCGPLPAEGCIVYSLGSMNDFRFEEAILAQTNCKIWTFDCTVDGKQLHPERHHFEKLCIGEGDVNLSGGGRVEGGSPLPFARLEDIMRRLGHREITYLKIDIEGSEFDVMQNWRETNQFLPLQIAVEVHEWGHRYSDIIMYFRHMADLGYAIVKKEDNFYGACCAEFLLLKVEQRVCSDHHGTAWGHHHTRSAATPFGQALGH